VFHSALDETTDKSGKTCEILNNYVQEKMLEDEEETTKAIEAKVFTSVLYF
jgi:hypothetical protein